MLPKTGLFVILRHEMPAGAERESHFDFMLQRGDGRLKTWALSDLPPAGGAIKAEELADHRPEYLEYEGPVSGERGSVKRIAQGQYCTNAASDASFVIQLTGTVNWRLQINRTSGKCWQFIRQ